MPRPLSTLVAALTLVLALLASPPALAQSAAITYQGELKQTGSAANGDFEFRFRIFDADTGGTQLAESIPPAPVLVQDGRFTVQIVADPTVFTGAARFLQIGVRTPGAAEYVELQPRQALTSSPGASVARLALASANQSIGSQAIQNAAVGAQQINDGQVQRRVDGSCPAGESIRAITSLGLVACETDDAGPANAWVNGGNAFGAMGVLGTTDAQPLEFRVQGTRVGRISGRVLPNVVFGDHGNTVGANATAVTISGGGWASIFGAFNGDNAAYDNGGTVSGGIGNTAGSDDGGNNLHQYGSIGGGFFNTASGSLATVAGGQINIASGEGAAVPGGYDNNAAGEHSLAAGRSADALHNNSFVWSGVPGGFASSGAGQFVARAPGGFGFNTNAIPAGIDTVLSARDGGNTDVWIKSGGGNIGFNFGVTGSDASNSGMYIARYDGVGFYDFMLFNAAGHVDIFRNLAIQGTASTPANAWTTWSDARLKRDVQPLQGVLDRLLALQGVNYEYRTDVAFGNYSAGRKTGFIAQEVERVFPEWVGVDANGYRQLTIQGFEALAVEALRELKAGSDARIDALERDNDELRTRLQRLEQLLLRDRF